MALDSWSQFDPKSFVEHVISEFEAQEGVRLEDEARAYFIAPTEQHGAEIVRKLRDRESTLDELRLALRTHLVDAVATEDPEGEMRRAFGRPLMIRLSSMIESMKTCRWWPWC